MQYCKNRFLHPKAVVLPGIGLPINLVMNVFLVYRATVTIAFTDKKGGEGCNKPGFFFAHSITI